MAQREQRRASKVHGLNNSRALGHRSLFFKTRISCNHNHGWWWGSLKTECPPKPPDLVIPTAKSGDSNTWFTSHKKWNVYKKRLPK